MGGCVVFGWVGGWIFFVRGVGVCRPHCCSSGRTTSSSETQQNQFTMLLLKRIYLHDTFDFSPDDGEDIDDQHSSA